eukprot:SAG11_NODE_16565_length_544_cov_0.579775_1_plen_85_part_10
MYGAGLFDGVAGDMRYLTIVSRDRWANDRYGIGNYSIDDHEAFRAIIFANDDLITVTSELVDPSSSLYEISTLLTTSGRYSIQIL